MYLFYNGMTEIFLEYAMRTLLILFCVTAVMEAETLNGLVRYALKHSVGVQQSEAAVTMSSLDRQMSEATLGGEFDLVGSAMHYNIERTLAPVPPSAMKSKTPITTSQNIFSLGMTYNVMLFTGGAQMRQVHIDELGTRIARLRSRLTREQIVYNVRMLYLSILAQDGILTAQQHYVRALRKLRDQIAAEIDAGQKAEVDLLKARADLSAAQTQVQMIRSGIEMTRAGLSALVGRKVGRLRSITIQMHYPRYSVNRLMKQAHSTARIQAEELGVEQARQRALQAEAANAPKVALSAYGGKNFGQDVRTDEWDDEFVAQVGINVKFNAFDFGKSAAGREKARVAKIRAQLKRRQALLDLRKEITQAVEKIKQSYTQYTGALQVQRLSRKARDVERTRYQGGSTTLNDLLMAESKYRLASAKTVEAKYNYQKSRYYLDFVTEKGTK
jgi:outer membrane protein TolC